MQASPVGRRRSEPGGEQLPLQPATQAQSWEELAGASVAYVRPLFLGKHSSVFAAISPSFLTPSFRLLAASQPCALGPSLLGPGCLGVGEGCSEKGDSH